MLGTLGFVELDEFFTTASLWEFILVGFFLYLLGLAVPFVSLLWVMMIKFFMGGDIYRNNVTPGVYPKWSKMHLRIWCIGRLENMVLAPVACDVSQRAADGIRVAAARRDVWATTFNARTMLHLSGPLDLISIEDDVAIQTGAYIQTTSWSGQDLHVGLVHLESGCKIGMRAAIANNVTVGRGTWITPFTPILSNVGSQEMWEGAPARLSGRCTELKRTANDLPVRASDLATGDPQHPDADLPILLVSSWSPPAAIFWFARGFIPARRS